MLTEVVVGAANGLRIAIGMKVRICAARSEQINLPRAGCEANTGDARTGETNEAGDTLDDGTEVSEKLSGRGRGGGLSALAALERAGVAVRVLADFDGVGGRKGNESEGSEGECQLHFER